jgi:hypothetical protein
MNGARDYRAPRRSCWRTLQGTPRGCATRRPFSIIKQADCTQSCTPSLPVRAKAAAASRTTRCTSTAPRETPQPQAAGPPPHQPAACAVAIPGSGAAVASCGEPPLIAHLASPHDVRRGTWACQWACQWAAAAAVSRALCTCHRRIQCPSGTCCRPWPRVAHARAPDADARPPAVRHAACGEAGADVGAAWSTVQILCPAHWDNPARLAAGLATKAGQTGGGWGGVGGGGIQMGGGGWGGVGERPAGTNTVLLLETLRSKVFTGRVSSFPGFFNCLPVASKIFRVFQMVYRLKI